MSRNILAVVCGFVIWTVVWLTAGKIANAVVPGAFEADGSTRHSGVLVTLLGASGVCSVIAGLAVALITRGRKLPVALALGVILLAVGIFVQAQFWNLMPLWYHLIFLVLLIPLTLTGAALGKRK